MKKIISIILICALIATLAISLISCTDNGNEDDTKTQNILPPDLGGEDEGEQTTGSDGEEDWGLGSVPLH